MTSDKASDDIQHETIVDEKVKVPIYHADVDTNEIDEAKLLRKLDWALIPWSVVSSLLAAPNLTFLSP